VTALARAAESLRVARRELEAAASEVPAYHTDSLRWLRAEVQAIRGRVEHVERALGELGPEPPGGA
jgi:hypothetical protein